MKKLSRPEAAVTAFKIVLGKDINEDIIGGYYNNVVNSKAMFNHVSSFIDTDIVTPDAIIAAANTLIPVIIDQDAKRVEKEKIEAPFALQVEETVKMVFVKNTGISTDVVSISGYPISPLLEGVWRKVREIASSTSGVRPSSVFLHSSLFSDLGMDSLDYVEFLMNCESEFRVSLAAHEEGDNVLAVCEAICRELTNKNK